MSFGTVTCRAHELRDCQSRVTDIVAAQDLADELENPVRFVASMFSALANMRILFSL